MRGRQDALCFSGDGICSWGNFAADVAEFRKQIAEASHSCNLLTDRYDFMIALSAAMLNGQVSILPSAAAPEAIAAALDGANRPVILGGTPQNARAGLHISHVSKGGSPIDPEEMVLALEQSHGEIHVFTSGSTKQPVRYRKAWSTLAGGAAVTEKILQRLGVAAGTCAIVGTTPHQHMYGLEATIFTGLGFGHCIYRGTVFYPADLEKAVADARRAGFERIVLVTSPAHLKFLEAVILESPEICGIISATAPLSRAQATRLEARGDLPVMEIYGATETGSLAIRRTVEGEIWEPLAGFTLDQQPEGCLASAPHLSENFLLGDAIDLLPNGTFRLLGRLGEMVSVAGKRTGLTALNEILVETAGILDGVVLHRRTEGDDLLAIVAVIDPSFGVSADDAKSAIRRQFRKHVDPIFAPKRISFVESLPRSSTGKIPAREMETMLQAVLSE